MDELRVKKRKSVKELSIQMDLVKSVVNYKDRPDKRQQAAPQLYDKKQNMVKNEVSSPNTSSITSPKNRRASVGFFLPSQRQTAMIDSDSDSDDDVINIKTPQSARSNTSSSQSRYPVTVPLYERRIHSARSSRVRKFANFC
ncbi:predicted protein [Naegleria gruberi]|uniref:Predicted protein n=1 Tax=Naegleria gruberi TaxID=5762 RepID=D2VNQ0_NAEGR|nr:uncharacterized protein NAEGRDRAFT_70576 [Naegleria gruberi]EFC41447.1 predicted protein [Naegleria gruberi]|eukprot:XP_002674191.1 predicted protein [Naegleria gruberi strain NEG-M]